MQLTETQITQANKLIKKYKFCSFETQRRLQENGFFEKVECNFNLHMGFDYAHNPPKFFMQVNEFEKEYDADVLLSFKMPQFHEVWEALPPSIIRKDIILHKELGVYAIYYANTENDNPDAGDGSTAFIGETVYDNICESACLLWLKLKEKNLL